MTIAEHEHKEEDWKDAHTQVLEDFLKSKRADKHCHRCGNGRFLIPKHNYGPLFVTYCSRCGFKNEHLVSILLSEESEA